MKIYSVVTGFRAVTTAEDLVELTAASTRSIRIHEVIIGQSSDYGDAEAEGLEVTLLRYIGAFTSGNGTSVTPSLYGSDDLPAADATAERNAGTLATGGTAQTLMEDVMNIQAGFHFLATPELRINVAPTDAFVVRISAPTDSLTMCCTVIFEET